MKLSFGLIAPGTAMVVMDDMGRIPVPSLLEECPSSLPAALRTYILSIRLFLPPSPSWTVPTVIARGFIFFGQQKVVKNPLDTSVR